MAFLGLLNIGFLELLLLTLAAVMLFGGDLPGVARKAGTLLGRLRSTADDLKVVTKREPTEDELKAMLFGWRVVKHVKSNAIVYCGPDRTLGIGAGQMSRIDSARLAIQKAKKKVTGCVMASDAFFPFRDSIDTAAEAGVWAIIQPGGSIRDEEVNEAANEHNLAMMFTGIRHFKH